MTFDLRLLTFETTYKVCHVVVWNSNNPLEKVSGTLMIEALWQQLAAAGRARQGDVNCAVTVTLLQVNDRPQFHIRERERCSSAKISLEFNRWLSRLDRKPCYATRIETWEIGLVPNFIVKSLAACYVWICNALKEEVDKTKHKIMHSKKVFHFWPQVDQWSWWL